MDAQYRYGYQDMNIGSQEDLNKDLSNHHFVQFLHIIFHAVP